MTTSHPTPYNYSLQAVPTAFGLALVPHCFYLVKFMTATNFQMSLTNPRMNLDTWKGKLSNEAWTSLAKLRGAHINSLEVFPLFAASMIAGNVAKMPVQDLNSAAASFLGCRVAYLLLYSTIKSNALAPLRTTAYFASITIPMLGLWRAGQKMAAEA